MKRYDAIVIGSGPAGLSAALTLKIRNKDVLVIGNSETSGKLEKAHEINNYLGFPKAKGSDLAESFLNHIRSMEIEIIKKQVLSVYAMGEYFALSTSDNGLLEAKTVILAMGVSFGKPYIGEENFLGRGVSYCATCDAPLYREKKVVIIGETPNEEAEAEFMAELASEVVYIPLYKEEVKLGADIKVLRDKPLEISGSVKAEKLILKENEIEADGIFILRENVSPSQLVPGISVEDRHIAVNRKMETSISGCFACGDVVGMPYQYIKAAGEGNIAALSAVEYLAKNKKADDR